MALVSCCFRTAVNAFDPHHPASLLSPLPCVPYYLTFVLYALRQLSRTITADGSGELFCVAGAAGGRPDQHLSLLSHGDLVCFSSVSRECHTVATMDRLWLPLIARHFAGIKLPTSLHLMSPAHQFRALALSCCYVCWKPLLPAAEARNAVTCHSNTLSCAHYLAARHFSACAVSSLPIAKW
jgi:hypothetical protein